MSTRRAGQSVRRRVGDAVLALYSFALVVLTLAALLAPQRVGWAALAQVLAHFLFLPVLVLLPFALARGRFLLRSGLFAAALTFGLVYPPALNLLAPPITNSTQLSLLTWNMFVGGPSPEQLRAALDEYQPDVAVLQEVRWEPLADDAELAARYPYRLLQPDQTAPGLAVLSRYPIVEWGVPAASEPVWDMPRIVWARLDLGGRTVTVVNAHPIPPRTLDENCTLLRCYNRGPRDAQIAQTRVLVEQLRQRNDEPLILAGDMNVTEREPAYFELAAGLRDTHRAVGKGFGASWRPKRLNSPFGLLRIDYIFSDERLQPTQLQTDCTERGSDHCLLVGRFAFS